MSEPPAPPARGARALAHPLPPGMRDLLPEEAAARRALARRVLDHVASWGYELVTPPAFEFAAVLERGLGTLDPGDLLRFVEPESGEIAALRPDMTPQIARMASTRLAQSPLPMRLCYEGTVVRRRQGRARRHRQIPQAGVELLGAPAGEGDVEVLALCASTLRATGLTDFVLDLGHAGIARALLEGLPDALVDELTEALAHKDVARIDAAVSRGDAMPAAVARALVALPDLSGGGATPGGTGAAFARARPVLDATAARGALHELDALVDAAARHASLGPHLAVDLGEVRGLSYYTGVIFHALADGPGEPIAGGGRYDDLLARFDAPMDAVGFAVHLDAVARARAHAGLVDAAPLRVLCACGSNDAELCAALRVRGVAAAAHRAGSDALGFARAWRFSHVVEARDGALVLVDLRAPSAPRPLPPHTTSDAVAAVVATVALDGEAGLTPS